MCPIIKTKGSLLRATKEFPVWEGNEITDSTRKEFVAKQRLIAPVIKRERKKQPPKQTNKQTTPFFTQLAYDNQKQKTAETDFFLFYPRPVAPLSIFDDLWVVPTSPPVHKSELPHPAHHLYYLVSSLV